MTQKYIVFSVRDGSTWGLPAEAAAKNRAEYYAPKGLGSYAELYAMEYDKAMEDDYELYDWAANNMDWEDIEPHIVKLADPRPMRPVDYRFGWQESMLQVILKEVPEEPDSNS